MKIYVGLFLLFIAIFIIYRTIKIRNQFRRSISREENVMLYGAAAIKSWPTAIATLDSVEIKQVVTNGQAAKFQLVVKFIFEVNGQQYSCENSPYTALTTHSNNAASSLRDEIINTGEYFIYYNPTNAQESFYIFNGFLSWSDYELLIK